jgi:hypothetical protein
MARQPVWLLGFASMLAGFGLQVVALHYFHALAGRSPWLRFRSGFDGPVILMRKFT